MFSSDVTEECVKDELAAIFQVKLVAKNIVIGYPGTYFMHKRGKI